MTQPALSITYYLYVLSTWSLCAEPALQTLLERFGGRIRYQWRLAPGTYGENGPYRRAELAYYYDRLEAATGTRFNLGWWYEGYDPHVADRIAEAARLLGAVGNEARLALAKAALIEGRPITRPEVGIPIAADAARLDAAALEERFESPEVTRRLAEGAAEFAALPVSQRPAFVMRNEIGDTAILSGIWRPAALLATAETLLADQDAQLRFRPGPP